MSRAVSDWNDAAAKAYSRLSERKRVYPKQAMLSLLDELAMMKSATKEMMLEKNKADFIETTLGHVTTAVHGHGPVPKEDGWYSVTSEPHTYHILPAFGEAWKAKRGL